MTGSAPPAGPPLTEPTPPLQPQPPDRTLTRGTLLARNVGLNLGGAVLPALAALVAIPLLVGGLGDARFGVLALVWTLLGYFSLFDLGIGRAVTHAVADRLGHGRESEIGTVVRTSMAILVPVGLLAAVIPFAAAPALARFLNLPGDIYAESVTSFRLLAAAMPFMGATAALRGVLEARQLFGAVNALRVPYGLLQFLGPLAALAFSRSLVPAVAVLVAGRILLFAAHVAVARRAIPRGGRLDGTVARRLLTIGGWMQVSHMVSPLMATLDRFIVGAVLGVGLVTYYAVPQELVTKLWLYTIAVLPVFFTALATTAARDAVRTAVLFDRLLRLTMAVMFIPSLVLVALAPDILRIWLGSEFVAQSSGVMQVLTIAVFINTVGQGGYTLIQAMGRPDLTGKFHLAELPIYAVLLWILLPRYGIYGAALAWSIRTIGDTVLLLATCPILLRETRATVTRMGTWLAMGSLVLLAGMAAADSAARFALVALAIPAWIGLVWRLLLTPEERVMPLAKLIAALRPGRA